MPLKVLPLKQSLHRFSQPHSRQRSRTRIPVQATSSLGSQNVKRKVLVVPAYLIDAQEFVPLVEELRSRGFDAALPSIRWFNWTVTIGGRSLRPILDRIDYAVTQLANGVEVGKDTGFEIPMPEKNGVINYVREFSDPSQGAVPPIPSTGSVEDAEKVALVAISAAGWISRIFLGNRLAYDGRTYYGADRVDSLVTLGAPHLCNEGVSKKNINFVNDNYPGCFEPGVKYTAVAGKAKEGKARLGGLIQDFTYQSYMLCLKKGDVWGDGVIPVECALGLPGAEQILLDDVWHLPGDAKNGKKWYGSKEIVDSWVEFLT